LFDGQLHDVRIGGSRIDDGWPAFWIADAWHWCILLHCRSREMALIYSKTHPKTLHVHLVGYKGIVTEGPSYITCPYIPKIFDLSFVQEPTDIAAKLKAIGIDPAFLCSDTIDFDYEAALTEFQEDYNIMFPEDKA
jgi:hypothetical protein